MVKFIKHKSGILANRHGKWKNFEKKDLKKRGWRLVGMGADFL
jgi:hypothetical protein